MQYNWTKEDVALVEKFIDIKNRGYYCDGKQLTDVYNRVLNKRVNPTNCSACLRQRTQELENALNAFKRLSEASKPQEQTVVKEEENKAVKTKKKGK